MTGPLSSSLLTIAAKQAGHIAARALIRKLSKESPTPGDVVRVACQLRDEAHEVLVRAVVYERARGVSWEVIGAALGMTRQSAFKQFQGAEKALGTLAASPVDDLDKLARRVDRIREGAISR